jgi:hypothetical protein
MLADWQKVLTLAYWEAVEAELLLDALTGRGGSMEQYIYCSSAAGGCCTWFVYSAAAYQRSI